MALVFLALYALLIFGVSRFAGRRGAAGFYVNNRESGPWNVGISILVSCIGASATLGMIGLAFAVGTPAFWWLGAGSAGLVLLSLVLARKVRGSGAYTLPHMVESFLGPSVRPVISLVIVVAWSAILAAQYSALCRVLEPLTGFSPLVSLLLAVVLICGHTLGGQSAIMRVDRIQVLFMILALGVMLGWLTWRNPEWAGMVQFQAVNAEFPLSKLMYFLVIVGANYVVCPMLFGRLFSARDEQSARLGGLIGAFGIALCAALIVAVGLACKGLVPIDTPRDAVLTTVLGTVMPEWMQLLVSLALVSAIVSSADSCLITAATVLSFDLLGGRNSVPGKASCAGQAGRAALPAPSVRLGQVCVVLLGLAGAALSLWGKGILGFLLMAYDVFACGVVTPVFIGLILHKKRRINPRWASAAVAAGGVLGLVAAVSGDNAWSYAGMALSCALTLGGAMPFTESPLRE